ncbi:MAG: S1 RNA-binding domain-containing protein, partial [Bdellovibrionaceae bacterium]|nr:S1 RNA-binding domain-containing protein [Pseudobdellovibrionaceae bacterium]
TKAFEQAAGFLRIPGGKVFLDSTGIHPERYQAVRDMAQELGVSLSELTGEGAKKLLALRTKWAEIIGEFTFDDIVRELEKPGRDPRDPFKVFHFRDDIFEVKDLKEGMICPGIVTNVTNFGAFVDIGVHQDGLVHISEIAHKFVDDPRKVVSPGDQVTVKVIKVDLQKNQISLSMKIESKPESSESRPPRPKSARGDGDKSSASRKSQDRNLGKKKGGAPHRPQDRRPSPAPFNNPFAALLQAQQNSKK